MPQFKGVQSSQPFKNMGANHHDFIRLNHLNNASSGTGGLPKFTSPQFNLRNMKHMKAKTSQNHQSIASSGPVGGGI